MMVNGQRGQVTVETAVLFGIVVAGLVAMATYLQRGVQGGMKSNADSFGTQFSAGDAWEVHSRSQSQETAAQVVSAQTSDSCQGVGGVTNVACTPTGHPALPGTSGAGGASSASAGGTTPP